MGPDSKDEYPPERQERGDTEKEEQVKTAAETEVMSPAVKECRSHWKLEEAVGPPSELENMTASAGLSNTLLYGCTTLCELLSSGGHLSCFLVRILSVCEDKATVDIYEEAGVNVCGSLEWLHCFVSILHSEQLSLCPSQGLVCHDFLFKHVIMVCPVGS